MWPPVPAQPGHCQAEATSRSMGTNVPGPLWGDVFGSQKPEGYSRKPRHNLEPGRSLEGAHFCEQGGK